MITEESNKVADVVSGMDLDDECLHNIKKKKYNMYNPCSSV